MGQIQRGIPRLLQALSVLQMMRLCSCPRVCESFPRDPFRCHDGWAVSNQGRKPLLHNVDWFHCVGSESVQCAVRSKAHKDSLLMSSIIMHS